MANVIIRFSVYSEEEGIEIEGIKEILKNADEFHLKGDEIFLTDGKPSGQIFRKTSFMYTSKMMSINNIGICNSKWMREWRDNVTCLLLVFSTNKPPEDYFFIQPVS